jgi:hypothetical protein
MVERELVKGLQGIAEISAKDVAAFNLKIASEVSEH